MPQKRSVRGPFRPGAGSPPPYLAGRENEQALFLDLLEDLGNGVAPPADVVLHGPRGNGKTSLLAWLEEEAASHSRLDVVFLNPSQCRTEEALAGRLLSASWWKRLSPAELSVKGLTWRPGEGPAPSADEVLAGRASRRPLMFVLDEAHTVAPAVGNALLNASQMVRRRLPFLLVLAGTPGLRRHLGRMSASFWSRSQAVPIGRLDSDDSAAAIERPLRDEGVGLDREARDRIVDESHGYPYFLQLWGQAVWLRLRNAVGPARRVTGAVVDAARPDFDFQKDFYYQERYTELLGIDRLPSARAVAEAFRAEPLLDDAGMQRAVHCGLGAEAPRGEVLETVETFESLGYIWRARGTLRWEPGIPSLMTHLLDNTSTGS